MKKALFRGLLCVVLACGLFAGYLYANHCIGVSAGRLEADVRGSQKILDDWTVDGEISDTMAAFISYPQDRTDHTYSIYVNRPGLSFGYFFRGGGDIVAVERYISEFTVEGYSERAFVSMNMQKVDRLEIDGGSGIRVVEIDETKPFAVILPVNAGSVCFYDVNGSPVEYVKHPL